MNTPQQDTRTFLEYLFRPGDVFEVRAPAVRASLTSNFTATVSGYFQFEALDAAVAAIAELDESRRAPAIYSSLNPVDPRLLARSKNRLTFKARSTTSDADIIERRWILVDVDPVRPSGVSASDAEVELARDRFQLVRAWLSRLGWPDPLVSHSGNGFHGIYPANLTPDDDSLVRSLLGTLSAMYSDDRVCVDRTTYNPARVVKVAGTLARKGDHFEGTDTIEARPHRRARLLEVPK